MPAKKKFEDIIYVRGLAHRAETLNKISDLHRIDHVELARGLVEAACDFYEEHGFFSFPVRIEPEAFQRQWLAAEGRQSGYEPSPTAVIEAEEAARRDDAARKKKARTRRGGAPHKPATGGA